MENYTVNDIIKATGGYLLNGAPNDAVSNISTDTRTIKKNDLFVALIGDRFDGHEFAIQSIEQGAMGVVLSHEVNGFDKLNANLNIIMVKDTTQALGDIAKDYRNRFEIAVIGITGSNGKTTTKDMASAVLSAKFNVHKSEGNLNNTIGLPLTLFKLSKLHEIAVLEMGISIPGEMSRLVEIAQPNIAIITNVSPTHLEFLGSVEGVAREKEFLAKSADQVILNKDDPYVAKMGKKIKGKAIYYGIDKPANITAKKIQLDNEGRAEFILKVNAEDFGRIKLSIIGRHNVYNALRAIAVGILYEVDFDKIKSAIETYQPISMRMQKLVVNGITIINDTYNSNPMSMIAAIDLLASLKSDGKKVLVVGDMLELGEESNRLHDDIGEYIGKSKSAEMLVTMGEKAVRIAETAIAFGMEKSNVSICQNNSEVIERLGKILSKGDIVLIKGSRGMKMEQIVKIVEERQ
jgi:UDP-N-acetylmuramoyl-tripeptide--D-alanyl-D-alanine ligase